jgi:uncharacterized protein (TIGR02265 family)
MVSLSTAAAPAAFAAPGLDQLLVLAKPDDTCRGMFFNGLFDLAQAFGGAEARARCVAVAGERRYVDFLSYPVADFLRTLFTAAELLSPRWGGRDAAFHEFGRRSVDVFLGSSVGRTMLALAGHEPKRLLNSYPRACKAALSYGERTVEWLGPQQARMVVRRDFLPTVYVEGALSAVLERSSAQSLEIRGRRVGVLDVDYDIRWE